jgi:RNA-dependent RNA polymerase
MADFTIIWDQRFVQSLNVFEAMDYTAPPPVKVPRVTQMHLNEVSCL